MLMRIAVLDLPVLDLPVLVFLARRLLASALRRPAAPAGRQGGRHARPLP
jgi:hypothetical protein